MNSQPDSAPQPQREFIPRRSWLATPLGRHRFLLFMVAAFAALLVLVPLPLGSNRIWAASLASLWNQLLLMTLTIAWIREPQLLETPFTRPLRYAGILFMAVIAWMIVQMMPGIATELQHPLWADAAKLLQEQGLLAADSKDIGRIALDPSASILSLVRITGYAASFCLALLLAQDSRRANILLGVIIVAGVAYAGYGFAIELSGKNTVLWFEKRAYRGNLTSTFFNRNSYAAYAGLGLLSSSAYVFQRWHKAWRNTTRRFFWRDFLENLAGRELYWIALPLVFMAALILSEIGRAHV